MKFKRIYVELTNRCNLNCSFCSKSKRMKKDMTKEKFKTVVKKIKPYTDNIYLHIKGEPLLYPDLDSILTICDANKINVNITTNGTLLKERCSLLIKHPCIRHINISLHAEQNQKDYFDHVFHTVDKLKEKVTIIYRIWTLTNGTLDEKSTSIVEKLIGYYNLSTEIVENIKKEKNIKLQENIYLDKDNQFEWPSEATSGKEEGYCMGGKTHIGILSDGTIVPCCLDGEGTINLGNILTTDMEEILNSKRFQNLIEGFKNRKVTEPLCKKCSYKNRF